MIGQFRVLVGVPFLMLLGCGGEPTGPRPVEGTYAAVRANGSPLPTMLLTYPSGDGLRLVQGSLTLDPSDTLTLVLQTQYVSSSGTASAPASDTLRALYQVEGSALELSPIGSRPLDFDSPGAVSSDGSVRVTARRPLPPSSGIVGTYPIELLFRR